VFRRLSRFSAGWLAALGAVAAALGAAWRVRRLLVRERIDVIHANNFKMLLLAALANVNGSRPLIWHVRDILPSRPLTRWTHWLGARLATRVIAVSHAVARQFSGAPDIVHNAVTLPMPGAYEQRVLFRQQHALPQDAFVFGYVGRLDRGKGIDTLLEAFDRISAAHPRAWLAIAGEGGERVSLEAMARRRSLDRVRFAGFSDSPGEAYAAIDCLVAPSVEPDSFPRSVIEAMSWSRAVIGSNSGGIPEAIVDGVTGSLFAAGDVDALAAEMNLLAENPNLARARGAAGRARCEECFAVENQIHRIEAVYREVLRDAPLGAH
jgi:glycosyltransferase involved in cell wall biosynthesis